MIKYQSKILSAGLLLLVISFISCDRNRNHPGWDYFPDMFYSEAYESYTENPNFEDGKTVQKPVEGTVSRELIPFQYSIAEEERIKAGEELRNPLRGVTASIERGKEAYTAFCQNCHGEQGRGDGYLHSSGRYIALPRSLVNENARNLKDGEIYHSITVGYGSMGAHDAQVRPDDRWKIINYIRMELQPAELKREQNSAE